jgi:hypothetical protein
MNAMSTYTSKYGMTQISIRSDDTDRVALLTRFEGQRTWSVMGGYAADLRMTVTCYDGLKTKFLKSTAIELANRWVDHGDCYL